MEYPQLKIQVKLNPQWLEEKYGVTLTGDKVREMNLDIAHALEQHFEDEIEHCLAVITRI